MAGELQVVGPGTGVAIYAVVHDNTGALWYTVGSAFEAYNAAHWASYAIALAEQGASGYYVGTMPACAAGLYNLDLRQRIGGTPALTDPSIGSASLAWSGVAELSLASKLQLDETQVPASLVVGSWYDLLVRAAARSANFTIAGAVVTATLPGGRTVTRTVDSAAAPTTGITTVS